MALLRGYRHRAEALKSPLCVPPGAVFQMRSSGAALPPWQCQEPVKTVTQRAGSGFPACRSSVIKRFTPALPASLAAQCSISSTLSCQPGYE